MSCFTRWLTSALFVGLALAATPPETARAEQDPSTDMLDGILKDIAVVTADAARRECLVFPPDITEDTLGPHGDRLLSKHCRVESYAPLATAEWSWAHYVWSLEFTAEDPARGPAARDVVAKEEIVVFQSPRGGAVRPVWHARFETGPYAIWRSVTPDVAPATGGTLLLSAASCVNGTGGCSQEFLHRHANGAWRSVVQRWRKQLPAGYELRLRHGAQIDPRTLRVDAPFYDDGDPNCCPSHALVANLELRDDALVLRGSVRIASIPRQGFAFSRSMTILVRSSPGAVHMTAVSPFSTI